jgi:hypothetical protein
MPDLTTAILEHISRRPSTVDEVVEALQASGMDLGPEPFDAVEAVADAAARIYPLADERLVDVLTVLEGVTFTVAVSDTLDEEGTVWEQHWTDLSPVWWIAATGVPLTVEGGHTNLVTAEDTIHEERWIGGVEPGLLTGFRLRNGTLDVTPRIRPAPPVPDGLVAVFRELAAVVDENRAPAEVDPFLFEIMVDNRPVIGSVLPPLTVLAAEAGMEVSDGYLVTAGWDWDEWMPVDDDTA